MIYGGVTYNMRRPLNVKVVVNMTLNCQKLTMPKKIKQLKLIKRCTLQRVSIRILKEKILIFKE